MELVKLGKVVRLHGIVGEMKIATKLDDDFDLKRLDYLYDEDGQQFAVKRAFRHDGGLVVGLEGVDIGRAKSYVSKSFYMSRDLVAGKLLVEDVKGSDVYVGENKIGRVTDIQDFGAAEVIYVHRENGKELLLPNVEGLILSFDLATKTVRLDEKKVKEVSDYED